MRRRDFLWSVPGFIATAACQRCRPPAEAPLEVVWSVMRDWIGPYPLQPAHYREFLEWHSAAGRRAQFEALAHEVTLAAKELAGTAYDRAPAVVRDQVRSRLAGGPQAAAAARLRGETLRLFANTDAWRAIGYPGWPGRPQGLSASLQGPG